MAWSRGQPPGGDCHRIGSQSGVRVIDGPGGCEVVFTLRRLPGMSDEDFARDASQVAADLARLKRTVESG